MVAVVLVVLAGEDDADVTLVAATSPPVTKAPTPRQSVTATPPLTETPAPTQAVTSTATPQATPPAEELQANVGLSRIEGVYTPRLLVVTDGAPDSLILEWVVGEGHDGAADAVAGYQYRKRAWVAGEWQPWGPWVHIPGSEGVKCPSGGPGMATCSYRVKGLRPDTVYNFSVRSGSYALFRAEGVTQKEGVTPYMSSIAVAKGDGQMGWSVGWAYELVIPEGMRLRNESPRCDDCGSGFVLVDVETGSRLRYWSTWGGFTAPRTPTQQLVLPQCQREMEYTLTVRPDRTRGRDVEALFRHLLAPPLPLPSICSYEFSPLEYLILAGDR